MNTSPINIKNQLEISKSRLARAFGRLEGVVDTVLLSKEKSTLSLSANHTELLNEIADLKNSLALSEQLNQNLRLASFDVVEEVNQSIAALLTLIDNRNAHN